MLEQRRYVANFSIGREGLSDGSGQGNADREGVEPGMIVYYVKTRWPMMVGGLLW